MTGTAWVEESGLLEGPVMITNTHSVGVVRDAVIEWQFQNNLFDPLPDYPDVFWSLPVVAETYDGDLNDINGFHVRKEHAFNALDAAQSGPVAEGNVGGGTGMSCHQFKGGIGTASRLLDLDTGSYTLGVLVQANYGVRDTLTIAGVPVGREITDLMPEYETDSGREKPGIRLDHRGWLPPMHRCCRINSNGWPGAYQWALQKWADSQAMALATSSSRFRPRIPGWGRGPDCQLPKCCRMIN